MGFTLSSVLPWWSPRREERLEPRWERLVEAARETEYYLGIDPNKAPPLELADFYRNHKLFERTAAERPPPRPLEVPWQPLPRVVALTPWFAIEPAVWIVMQPSSEALMDLKPEALAGPVDALRTAARAVLQTSLRLPSIRFGIVAFTGVSQDPLTPDDRDLLWRAFEVPVTEQFRGFQGELLAMDCERREGLHVVEEAALWERRTTGELLLTSFENLRHPTVRLGTEINGWIDSARCGCGNKSPRLRML